MPVLSRPPRNAGDRKGKPRRNVNRGSVTRQLLRGTVSGSGPQLISMPRYLPRQKEGLFIAVLFVMRLHCLFRMPSGVNCMSPSSVRVVCCLFVLSSFIVFGGSAMMPRGVSVMF